MELFISVFFPLAWSGVEDKRRVGAIKANATGKEKGTEYNNNKQDQEIWSKRPCHELESNQHLWEMNTIPANYH